MFKLIIIAAALVFAFIGYRKTFYPGWAVLFNLLIAVYISIMSAPQIVDKFPDVRNYLGNYTYSGGILAAAVIIFAVLQSFAFRFFTAVSVVSLPKLLNSLGAAILGFLTGSVIAGFLFFLINITPLADNSTVRSFTQDKQIPDRTNGVVLVSCDFIHNISLQPDPTAIDKQLENILANWRKLVTGANTKTPAKSEPNKMEIVE
ncbi:MAG: CvpA family protein [Phycisphaerae bacterium]|nr:CvpA family protein [Phycisphaerae bacterium]